MLVLERTFEVPDAEAEASARVRTYLERVGFRDDGAGVRFSRGSAAGSFFGTDPRRWACTLALTVTAAGQGTRLCARLEVPTIGQSVSRTERWFFTAELDALAPVASGELPPDPVTGELVTMARRQARIAWAVGLGFGLAALALLVRALTR